MKAKRISLATLLIIVLVAIDQLTKYLVVKNMKPYSDEIKIIGDGLVLYYIKNTGAAWGSFNKNTMLLAGVSVVMIIFLGYLFFKNIDRDDRKLLRLFTVITIGGAIGNLIDRIRLNYVVDFIYAKFIDFPVFNFADIKGFAVNVVFNTARSSYNNLAAALKIFNLICIRSTAVKNSCAWISVS